MPHKFRVTKLAAEDLQALNGHDVKSTHSDGTGYESPDYSNIRRIISFLDPQPEDVIYDLGSGMGRVVCLFSRRKVERCIGVELYPSLCEIAVQNAGKVRGRKSPIEIRQGDVAHDDLTDGTVFFLFNPFGPQTLRSVLQTVAEGQRRTSRQKRFVYYKDLHAEVFEACHWLEKYHEMTTFSGIRASFWRTK